MKKWSLALVLFFVAQSLHAEKITKIIGFAPKYIGEKVEVYAIEDYFSMKEKLLATAVVQDDSMFRITMYNSKTQKIYIKSKNNKGFIYIQPDAAYEIYMPLKNKYDEYRPLGNDVEISFINLPETDINFRILSFEKWRNDFLGMYYYKRNLTGIEFVQKLDTFKMNVEKAYAEDTSFYFKTYVRFSIAEMDDMQFLGARNRFEKYDFYLKKYPVMYDNDIYMAYLESFYKQILTRMPLETNNRVYLGVLKSSPTMVANAMAEEYTLKNAKILELVMIKTLSDSYFKSDFPQTNIISILDSIAHHSLFKENGVIAANLAGKLTEILPGSKAPGFVLTAYGTEEMTTLEHFAKKHLYIQFADLSIKESESEIELLKAMYTKYKNDVEIITIFRKQDDYSKKQKELLKNIPWKKYELNPESDVFKNYKINSFPSYVLIDAYGYIVASPALKPTPNGKYETIDKSFFYIQKMNQEGEK
jgi:hypothetical protein